MTNKFDYSYSKIDEADNLIKQVNSDILKNMKEEHRIQFEMHVQNLEKIKSEVASGAEGYHEAVDDIVKAMNGLLIEMEK